MIAKDGVSDDTVSCAEILQMRRLLILRPHNLINVPHYCHYHPPTPAPIPSNKADVLQVNRYGDICFGLLCFFIVYLLIAKKVLFTFQKSSAIQPWSISTPASVEPFIIVNSPRAKKGKGFRENRRN